MSEKQQEHFVKPDILNFRVSVLSDLENEVSDTIAKHASEEQKQNESVELSQLEDAIRVIERTALLQVDKMRRLGVDDDVIRKTVLGVIERASMKLSAVDSLQPAFNSLMEDVNQNVEYHIFWRMDVCRASWRTQ